MAKETTIEKLIQQLVIAYNSHDAELLISVYSENAEIRTFPLNTILFKGHEEIRRFYTEKHFTTEKVRLDVVYRMVSKNIVIDHEQIFGQKKAGISENIVIYQIEKNKIQTVWLLDEN